jgi:ribosomal silencing factor RsfS
MIFPILSLLLGSVIVHVMTPQMRNFYKLEKRWKEAEVTAVTYTEEALLYL